MSLPWAMQSRRKRELLGVRATAAIGGTTAVLKVRLYSLIYLFMYFEMGPHNMYVAKTGLEPSASASDFQVLGC